MNWVTLKKVFKTNYKLSFCLSFSFFRCIFITQLLHKHLPFNHYQAITVLILKTFVWLSLFILAICTCHIYRSTAQFDTEGYQGHMYQKSKSGPPNLKKMFKMWLIMSHMSHGNGLSRVGSGPLPKMLVRSQIQFWLAKFRQPSILFLVIPLFALCNHWCRALHWFVK